MKQIFSLLLACVIWLGAQADSPLTSTSFYQSYTTDVPLVKSASESHELTAEMITFFENDAIGDDQKLALINALGWGNEENLPFYESHLTKKYSLESGFFDSLSRPYLNEAQLLKDPFVEKLTHDELMCWSYLKVLDDYFKPINGLKAAMYTIHKDDDNFAYLFLGGLILSQVYLDQGKWCQVYMVMAEIRGDWKNCHDQLTRKAVLDAWDYIGIYEEVCKENGVDVSEVNADLDPHYTADDFKSFKEPKKGKRPDLEVVDVTDIEYISDINGTFLLVEVKNKGKVKCIPSAFEFATAMNYNDEMDDELTITDEKEKYTYNYKRIVPVPEIPAKSSVKVKVYIEDFWIYDPNCEIKIVVDPFEKIEEKKEKNNTFEFFAYG